MIQKLLLGCYRTLGRTGLLTNRRGRRLFEWAYDRYKSWYEVGDLACLREFIRPGDWIIDVGANIGFFTAQFGCWINAGGRVIAIEPERANLESLRRRLVRHGLTEAVDVVPAVAAEACGTLRLELNPHHPADHKIGAEGIDVRAVTLDSLLAERDWPRAGLIKIDVQGAEERVLRGTAETLVRFRPALFIEIDDRGLRRMGSSAEVVLAFLEEQGYGIHRIERGRVGAALGRGEALRRVARRGYDDFLLLQEPGSGSR